MRTAEELRKAVDGYMERRGWAEKRSRFDPFALTYHITTMDYTEIDAKIVPYKNSGRLVFKVDGKVTSIKGEA